MAPAIAVTKHIRGNDVVWRASKECHHSSGAEATGMFEKLGAFRAVRYNNIQTVVIVPLDLHMQVTPSRNRRFPFLSNLKMEEGGV